MMILRSAPASPFGRKVKIAATLSGLSASIQVVNADTMDADDSLRGQNPLGKIPVLILDDGRSIFDSRVIVEALDMLAGGGVLLPREHGPRLDALVLQSIGDGLMDAAVLRRYEIVWRAEDRREARWIEHQQGKIDRALAFLEMAPPALDGMINVGHLAVACALGYLDFRFHGAWRAGHPELVAWLAQFAARVPAYDATAPHA